MKSTFLFLTLNSNHEKYANNIIRIINELGKEINCLKYNGNSIVSSQREINCAPFNELKNLSTIDILINRSLIRKTIKRAKDKIQKLEITRLITFNDFYGINFFLIKACNELKIDTFTIQDGILLDDNMGIKKLNLREITKNNSMRISKSFDYHYFINLLKSILNLIIIRLSPDFKASTQKWGYGEPKKYMVWSEEARRIITRNNSVGSDVYLIDSPFSVRSSQLNLEKIIDKFGIEKNKPTILIIDQNFDIHGTWNDKEVTKYYNFLFNLSNSLEKFNFLMKFKSNYPIPKKHLSKFSQLSNFHYSKKHLSEFIGLSDIVLSVNSTVLFEALRINKRIGCFNWFNYSNPMIKNKVAFSIDNFDVKQTKSKIIKELHSLKYDKSINVDEIENFLSENIGLSTENFYSDAVEILTAT